ncbi:MAG: hypothetical protein ACKVOP_01380 [Sphingomonadaceae bacterium]
MANALPFDRRLRGSRAAAISLCLLLAGPAHGQAASKAGGAAAADDGDVVAASDDAFGRRIGVESIGLYGETDVRGFNLQVAGNYLLDGHYLVRAIDLPVAASGPVTLRVGANGLRTDFAAPSGVVQYAFPGDDRDIGSIEAGWWEGSGPVLLGRGAVRTPDARLSIAGGGQVNPWQRYTDGAGGQFHGLGGIARWRPTDDVLIAAVAVDSRFERDATTAFASAGRVPPRIRRSYFRGQDWMRSVQNNSLIGGYAELGLSDGWRFEASGFVSRSKQRGAVFNLVTFAGSVPVERAASNSAVILPAADLRATALEAKIEREFRTGSISHRAIVMARHRDSGSNIGTGSPFLLGSVADVDDFPDFERPTAEAPPPSGRDTVRQTAIGLGYRATFGSRLEMRGDIQRQRYAKRIANATGVREQVSTPILFSGAVSLALSSRTTGFLSIARGLEEAGVAPGNALNRGDVLNAVVGRQIEAGVKHAFPSGPTIIGGVFEIEKPLAGLGADGNFGYVGQVRNRGLEVSLAGPVTPRLTIVAGATYIDARVSGEQVRAGVVGSRPVGRPRVIALANATWQVPDVAGLSIDGGISFRGSRPGDALNSFSLSPIVTASLGLRQSFTIEQQNFLLRFRVANVFDRFAWNVGQSGLFSHTAPRTATLTLTADV